MIVGVGGIARSGKTTVANMLVDRGFVAINFTDPMVEMLCIIDPLVEFDDGDIYSFSYATDHFGYDDCKDLSSNYRELLQRTGTEWGREKMGEDFWVDQAVDLWRNRVYSVDAVFPQIRYPNEAQAVKTAGGVNLLVERPGVEPVNSHSSEMSLDEIDWDYVIVNDGTLDDLRLKVRAVDYLTPSNCVLQ